MFKPGDIWAFNAEAEKDTDNHICEVEGCDCNTEHVMQGETEEGGVAEYHFYCAFHMRAVKLEMQGVDCSGQCNHCKIHKPIVRPFRHPDEQLNAPIQWWGLDCITEFEIEYNKTSVVPFHNKTTDTIWDD